MTEPDKGPWTAKEMLQLRSQAYVMKAALEVIATQGCKCPSGPPCATCIAIEALEAIKP